MTTSSLRRNKRRRSSSRGPRSCVSTLFRRSIPGGLGLVLLMVGPVAAQSSDPREVGLSLPWLIFGFAAQGIFAARFLVQWITSEKRGESVIPTSFWVLSLFGGLALFTYFARRGDPVGMAGQAFGTLVYARNLYFIRKKKRTA